MLIFAVKYLYECEQGCYGDITFSHTRMVFIYGLDRQEDMGFWFALNMYESMSINM